MAHTAGLEVSEKRKLHEMYVLVKRRLGASGFCILDTPQMVIPFKILWP
jgi:hypothetical protein